MCANRKRHPPAARNFLGFSQHRDQIDRSARARDAQPQHCSVVRGCSQHRDQINPPKLAMHNHQKGFAKAIRLRDADPDLQVMTWVGMGRNGMERNGMEWNGMECADSDLHSRPLSWRALPRRRRRRRRRRAVWPISLRPPGG